MQRWRMPLTFLRVYGVSEINTKLQSFGRLRLCLSLISDCGEEFPCFYDEDHPIRRGRWIYERYDTQFCAHSRELLKISIRKFCISALLASYYLKKANSVYLRCVENTRSLRQTDVLIEMRCSFLSSSSK